MQKEKALQLITQHQSNSLVFARKEEIEDISPQYEPIVTVLEFQKDDFAPMGGGNFYPMKSATNRIADATGVSFTHNCGTREVGNFHSIKIDQSPEGYFYVVDGNYAVIGYAQGQRLKPDGTPRLSSVCEYEFNVVDRANEDFLNDFTKNKYIKTSIQARKKLLELKKFATRRASTGAELAVIRELAGVPTALKQEQINKPMLFAQVVENNQFKLQIARDLMRTPDGRQSVANAMFGTTQSLFGPQAAQPALTTSEDETVVSEGHEEVGPEPDEFDDFDDFGNDVVTETEERREILHVLEEYFHSGILPKSGRDRVQLALNNDGEYTIEQLRDLLKRCKDVEARRKGGVA
ncbi:hypothetical protein [Marispirochaeta aestuarii]|uniref:hypothetical protein n=1 Tax=Marispirochaeta aestuarii TaxID=1963862 RepID=UPI002ABD5372|nr:hypothetical protein [Marispirochaeta aestuarii]